MTEWITWTDVHPSGDRLVIGMEKGRSLIWDLAAGEAVHVIQRSGFVVNARWSPDGEQLAVAELDGKLSIFDQSWNAIAEIDTPFKLRSTAFHRDGGWFVAGGSGARAQVYDTATWKIAYEVGNSKYDINAVGFIRDQVALGYDTGWLEGYSDEGTKCTAAGEALPWAVSSLGVHPSQEGVIFGGAMGGMQSAMVGADGWRGGHQWRSDPPRPIAANSIAFSPDGSRFVVACSDDVARVFDWPAGLVPRLLGEPFHYRTPKPEWSQSMIVSSACFSPDGERIFTSHYDGDVRVWNHDGHVWNLERMFSPK